MAVSIPVVCSGTSCTTYLIISAAHGSACSYCWFVSAHDVFLDVLLSNQIFYFMDLFYDLSCQCLGSIVDFNIMAIIQIFLYCIPAVGARSMAVGGIIYLVLKPC